MRKNTFKPKQKICIACQSVYFQPRNSRGCIWGSRKYCSKKCQPAWNKGLKGLWLNNKFNELNLIQKGKNHPRWISDRTKLSKRQERNDMAYKEWRINVYKRDNFKCKISNQDCKGRIEAHHILGWTKYPELRYEINNGITLCHFHHPRKKEDENNLSPYFKNLVMNIK